MNVNLSTPYVSCGTNPTSHILDWLQPSPDSHRSTPSYVAFGSSCRICIMKISPEGNLTPPCIIGSYTFHIASVTCVKWVKNDHHWSENHLRHLVVGAADGSISLSCLANDGSFSRLTTVQAHEAASADFVCGIRHKESTFVLSASVDSKVKIFMLRNNDLQPYADIDLRPGFALCADFVVVYDDVLLALGTDTSTIDLYKHSPMEKHFQRIHSLTGHADWVRDVQFSSSYTEEAPIFLASASQDNYTRVWRMSSVQEDASTSSDSTKPVLKLPEKQIQISSGAKTVRYTIGLETVLAGHDGWINAARWNHGSSGIGHSEGSLQLVTASMDKCILVWEPETTSGIWMEKVRLGDIGGNAMGFYGALFSPDNSSIMAHSYHGGLHLWRSDEASNVWQPQVVPGGHFGAVEDIAWESSTGKYLLSTSADQTTRLHAPWRQHHSSSISYHEISRPQIHGYNMQCIASVNPLCFVSAGEEKVVRSFGAPLIFRQNFTEISQLSLGNDKSVVANPGGGGDADWFTAAEGASVPSLGLSNKATFSKDLGTDESEGGDSPDAPLVYFTPVRLTKPPTEDHLLQNTLWPELHKMYGHGYEVYCVAASHDGTLVASACKATKTEYAAVILWSVGSWQQLSQLRSHALTVTQLAFSPNDRYLLSVSRDRTWTVFSKGASDDQWAIAARSDKKTPGGHSRIIWSCAWTHDSKYFATGSRDKKVVVWAVEEDKSGEKLNIFAACSLDMSDSVTALDTPNFACGKPNSYLLAIGLENGQISLCSWSDDAERQLRLCNISESTNTFHAGTVRRLAFRPKCGRLGMNETNEAEENDIIQLASAGVDHSVRIYDISLDNTV